MAGIISYIQKLPFWSSSKSVRWAWSFILFVAFLAVAGPFIANHKPYYCKLDGQTYFPIFSKISESTLSSLHPQHSPVDWRTTPFETIWYAPIPYSHHSIDLQAGRHLSPFGTQPQSLRFRHWLGTDVIGRDVSAGMIRGCRVSLLIGIGSMLLAVIIGVPFGAVAAYSGNRGLRISLIQIIVCLLFLLLFISLFFLQLTFILKLIAALLLLSVTLYLLPLLNKNQSKKISLPADRMLMSIVSILDSFPGLFIVLILLVVVPYKGWVVVMAAIAFLSWTVMARYMRAEVYKMKEANYIRAAQILNFPHGYILRKHIIPYAFRPVMISFIFGVSAAILAESSLSFLGIGLPAEEMNWGKLLSQARNHFDAWWLVLFPGAAIFFTLLSLYTIGNAARDNLEKIE